MKKCIRISRRLEKSKKQGSRTSRRRSSVHAGWSASGDLCAPGVARPGKNERQQSQWTRRYNGERDDEDSAFGEYLHNNTVFPGALCGADGFSQLVEDCETGFPAETGRDTHEGNQKLQSESAHKCRVEVVRVLCDDAHGKEKLPETWTGNGKRQDLPC